jgi:hypothetical protein
VLQIDRGGRRWSNGERGGEGLVSEYTPGWHDTKRKGLKV